MACISFAVVGCKRVLAERLPIIRRCVERMFRMRPTKCLYEYSKDANIEERSNLMRKCSKRNRHASQNVSRGGCLMLEQFPQKGHHLETARCPVLHRYGEMTCEKILSDYQDSKRNTYYLYLHYSAKK
ncbi:uncharacterized protein TrAtP1_008720 [Trichoderma atroviride]|uniref:uncharacterized protein n=1 Tax=Hypocrea atroviridis TaxID=63577 RepID=UPI00332E275E|nr:hypothetical protein TrAtP1_008720 [Trichoderma atroviride]